MNMGHHSSPTKSSQEPNGKYGESDFDAFLAGYTKKENAKVHGVIIKCVDKTGMVHPTQCPYSPLISELGRQKHI